MTRVDVQARAGTGFADFSPLAHVVAKLRHKTLERQDAQRMQAGLLRSLIRRARNTAFGTAHGFEKIACVEDYQRAVPVRDYDAFWNEWWQASYPRLENVSWPGRIPYFALSSGTTTGRSKHIPYTSEMRRAAVRGFLDLLACHLVRHPESRLLGGAVLGLTGPTALQSPDAGVNAGAVSAITADAVPRHLRNRILPPAELANCNDWQEKIHRLAPLALQTDLRMLGGSPNWMLIFLSEVERQFGKYGGTLADWFPNLELIVHGGVNFTPYREAFKTLLTGSLAETRELYSASEGVFAYADRDDGDGLRLHLNGSVFFEFIPLSDVDDTSPVRHWIADVETGVDYAVVVTTAAGLWSYLVGDVVRFVDVKPPRLLVTGRVSQGLSAFGEHLLESEIAAAMAKAAAAVKTHVVEYTVSAVREASGNRHKYFVETKTPLYADAERRFADVVDAALSEKNEDYQELRKNDLAIAAPEVVFVTTGAFAAWMQSRRALGGQNKVPRLVSDEDLFNDMAGFLDSFTQKERPK